MRSDFGFICLSGTYTLTKEKTIEYYFRAYNTYYRCGRMRIKKNPTKHLLLSYLEWRDLQVNTKDDKFYSQYNLYEFKLFSSDERFLEYKNRFSIGKVYRIIRSQELV